MLERVAREAMKERGLLTDFSPAALLEVKNPTPSSGAPRDLRLLPWCSIDNQDSLDLDQLSVALPQEAGSLGQDILIAIADVDAFVPKGSAIDSQALHNATTVYTPATIFYMIPQALSTDLTSLNLREDRLAIVIRLRVLPSGELAESEVFQALVKNRARLSYDEVALWLEGRADPPKAVTALEGLADNILAQDAAAQALKGQRVQRGSLDFESREFRPVLEGDKLTSLAVHGKNRAQELIENLMVAANGVTAAFLEARGYPSLRRIVRSPKRWERIVAIAASHGHSLSEIPSPKALQDFLAFSRNRDPQAYPDLSRSILKLLGAGEYAALFPHEVAQGHFGLAVRDYSHSTAPNRRYPDLITHRLLKAAITGLPAPYGHEELDELASHCTTQEGLARKVERQVGKSAAALFLEESIGQTFSAQVTGAAEKGTYIRLSDPPVEAKLIRGYQGLDVGDKLKARLLSVDAEQGFLDFERV